MTSLFLMAELIKEKIVYWPIGYIPPPSTVTVAFDAFV